MNDNQLKALAKILGCECINTGGGVLNVIKRNEYNELLVFSNNEIAYFRSELEYDNGEPTFSTTI